MAPKSSGPGRVTPAVVPMVPWELFLVNKYSVRGKCSDKCRAVTVMVLNGASFHKLEMMVAERPQATETIVQLCLDCSRVYVWRDGGAQHPVV